MKLILFTLLFSLAHAQSLPEMDVKNWTNGGRAKTLAIFANEVYGKVPSGKVASEWALDRESLVFDGKVHRREYVLTLGGKLKVWALAYIPVTEKRSRHFWGSTLRETIRLKSTSGLPKRTMEREERMRIVGP